MDQIQNLLKDYGYGRVALPKADIQPFYVLTKEGKQYEYLNATLEALFEADVIPEPRIDASVSNISGQKALKMEAKAGLNFLEDIFQQLNLSNTKLAVEAAANRNLQLVYTFKNVTEDKLDLFDLDNYLSGAYPLKEGFNTYLDKLKRSKLYVITSVLKSTAMSIRIEDANGQQVQMDGAFEGWAGASFHFKRDKQYHYTLENPDGVALVFAYKAVQIFYDKAKWFQFWKPKGVRFTIKNATGPTVRNETEFPADYLDAGDTPIDF